MFITTCVTLGSSHRPWNSLRLMYTPMLPATTERPGLQGWALKATSFRGTPSVDGESFCTFFEALRCITQTLSIKQSAGQEVPTSSGECSGSSGT
jgi:hypothetical protein